MRVGIDLTALLPEATGVDTALLGLVRELARRDGDGRYSLFVNREDRTIIGDLGANCRIVPVSRRPRPARFLFQQVLLPALARRLRIDVVHSPSFIMPLVRGSTRHVLTIHDMTSFSRPELHVPLRRSATYRRAVELSIRRADLVTVPSDWVRGDVLARVPEVAPERVRLVPWGIGEEFRPRPAAEARRALAHHDLPSSFILFVGTIEPRKNVPVLLDAYARLAAEGGVPEDLVLAGRADWGFPEVAARIAALRLTGRVHALGYVARRDLPDLYAAARLFVYPSLEEGFGFPPLEAMACGTPTIASRTSSMREHLEGAAELVAPDGPDELYGAMRRLLRDDERRSELRSAGLARAERFGWERTGQAMVDCYASLSTSRRACGGPSSRSAPGGR